MVGDLARPRLGLTQEDFEAYGHKIDAIYHSGALVHGNISTWSCPFCQLISIDVVGVLQYPALRPANVGGTIEVLRMASFGGGNTVLHYISTVSGTESVYPIAVLW